MISSLCGTEMPFESDEKSGKVGRTFPDFDLLGQKGEAIHKERLFLHLKCLELV